MPVTAMVGAQASLNAKNLIPERRKLIGDVRNDTFNFLASKNVEFIPSESNCFMVNVKRPGKQFYADMANEKIYIGRNWPVWANWVRVTVGTQDEMNKFKQAFIKCYNA